MTTGDDCVSVPLAGTLDELISRFDSLKGNIVAGERGSEGGGETFCHATECRFKSEVLYVLTLVL